ncbi:hypothetical protein K438DRAFT_1945422 [Mycena galopus ATCC 62051]|nr:hypothetical protein K438DRAFT_1945422 [Mycena galopus ATCC 62051]
MVPTDQPFLVRRCRPLATCTPSLTSLLLPSSPLRTRPASVTTRWRSRPLRIIEIEEDDNEVEVVEPPRKCAKVVKIEGDDADEVELVEPSSRRCRLSTSPTPFLPLGKYEQQYGFNLFSLPVSGISYHTLFLQMNDGQPVSLRIAAFPLVFPLWSCSLSVIE